MVISKSTFISYLKEPHVVGSESFVGLNEVCKAYPYFQSAQLLLTKAYHTSENLNFEASLKKTAAYAANRKQLHNLLFAQFQPITTDNETTVAVVEDVPLPATEEDVVVTTAAEIKEIHPAEEVSEVILEQDTSSPDKTEPFPTSELTEEHDSLEEISAEAELSQNRQIAEEQQEKLTVLEQEKFSVDFSKIEEGNKEEQDDLDRQILSSAVSSSILLNVSNEIPDIDSLNPLKRAESSNEEVNKWATEETLHSEYAENNKTEEESKVNSSTESHSFTDWLKTLEEPIETIETYDDEEEEFDQETSSIPTVIKHNREKSSFYSPIKMARLSVQEDDDLMTVTLANIYADQGHLEKAIKAFEKLQLKYPEKRSYFAGRIKEIQIQLNT